MKAYYYSSEICPRRPLSSLMRPQLKTASFATLSILMFSLCVVVATLSSPDETLLITSLTSSFIASAAALGSHIHKTFWFSRSFSDGQLPASLNEEALLNELRGLGERSFFWFSYSQLAIAATAIIGVLFTPTNAPLGITTTLSMMPLFYMVARESNQSKILATSRFTQLTF